MRAALLLLAMGVVGCGVDPSPKYPAVARALMRRVDQDGDGRLSADEYYRLLLPGGSLEGGGFEALDTDGSGDLSEVELEAGLLAVDPVAVRHAALAAEGAARRAEREAAEQGPPGEPGGPQGPDGPPPMPGAGGLPASGGAVTTGEGSP